MPLRIGFARHNNRLAIRFGRQNNTSRNTDKMKSLKPSMRENKRYLLVEGKELRKNLEKAILDFVGVLGFSKASLEWIKENKEDAIISVNREAVNSVRASLAVWPKKMEVKKVSGTLRGLKK